MFPVPYNGCPSNRSDGHNWRLPENSIVERRGGRNEGAEPPGSSAEFPLCHHNDAGYCRRNVDSFARLKASEHRGSHRGTLFPSQGLPIQDKNTIAVKDSVPSTSLPLLTSASDS
ncbi:unnamed protein product [Cylicostephanus goldi]|uniref:Uncharacterized protein n=1 Tax=Cylicostephanus goldi TaxID=71465 RepID=A0A3P7PNU1_CYLGO|nr:unnamed protein product [Cylicostephanus goldi]